MWRKLFQKKSSNPTLHDDVFGELKLESKIDIYGKKVQSKFRTSWIELDGAEVKLELECGEQGALQAQKEFYDLLKNQFDVLRIDQIQPLFSKEIANYLDKSSLYVDFDSDLILRKLIIPAISTSPINWKLVYYYVPTDQIFTISFTDFTIDPMVKFE